MLSLYVWTVSTSAITFKQICVVDHVNVFAQLIRGTFMYMQSWSAFINMAVP